MYSMKQLERTKVKHRDITWDIAKGIGILLVVIGHSGCPIYLHNLIYLFHMGLFFFISGIFLPPPYRHPGNSTLIGKPSEWFIFVKKKIKRLYLPFVFYGTVGVLFHNLLCSIGWNRTQYSYIEIVEKLLGTLLFKDVESQFMIFWFLKSLFFGLLITYSLHLLVSSKKCQFLIILILYTLGYTCSYLNKHLFFSIEREMVVLCTIWLGSVCRPVISGGKISILSRTKIPWISAVVILLLSAFIVKIDVAISDFSFYMAYPLYSLIGVYVIYIASKVCKNSWFGKTMAFWGRHSMDILIFHIIGMQLLSTVMVVLGIASFANLWQVPTIVELIGTLWFIPYTLSGLLFPLCIEYIKKMIINRL